MNSITTIGFDIAKNVFQVHGVDSQGQVVLRRQLRRSEVLKFFRKVSRCRVGMEACATSHYWAREISAAGHEVVLMPPTRVKPYVKRGRKNDQVDAEACCEAMERPSMRFVPAKTVDQQAALMQHRARQLLIEQRTRLGNAIRAHLAEVGVAARKGAAGFRSLLLMIGNEADANVPAVVRPILQALAAQWHGAHEQITTLDRQIAAWHAGNEQSRRLATVPQIGPIIASALVATAGDATRFKNARQFAAWLGLVPSQNSSGGKERLGGITKSGDRYLRQLLVVAASGMIRRVQKKPEILPWLARLLERQPAKKAAVALANKLARIAWVLLARGETYRDITPIHQAAA